jgi:large subunit ribosomal protein L3
MKFILGKKLEMTQVYKADGTVIPVTAVLAETNVVTQIKSAEGRDGYNAVQVGFGVAKHIGKSRAGHLKDLAQIKTIKEFGATKEDVTSLLRGDQITVEVFAEGDKIKVTGTSKGKGFQGVVKRHGFHGQNSSHGHKDQERMPGSIGAGGVQRVFKGKRMAGRMGDEQGTVSGLSVVAIDAEKNIIYVKGAVPGARNSLVMIYGEGQMTIKREEAVTEPVVVAEETPVVETVEAPTEIVAEEAKTEEVKTEAPVEETKVEEKEETPVTPEVKAE